MDTPFRKRIRLPERVYSDPEAAFHIVVRARVDARPFRGLVGEAVWHGLIGEQASDRVDVQAACLMPDHLHVVASPASRSIVRWIDGFKSHTTRLSWGRGWDGVLWQPSFFDRLLRDEAEYWHAVNYIRENPVEASLCDDGLDWPWMLLPESARSQ